VSAEVAEGKEGDGGEDQRVSFLRVHLASSQTTIPTVVHQVRKIIIFKVRKHVFPETFNVIKLKANFNAF
jgi:hypothetical protein